MIRKVPDALRLSTGTVIIVMFAAIIIAFGTVLLKIWNADLSAAQREIASVTRVFEAHKQDIVKEMERYAASNAAYINVDSHPSVPWIENRFASDMAKDFQYDAAFLIDPDLKTIFRNTPEPFYDARFDLLDFKNVREEVERIRLKYVQETRLMPGGNGSFAGLFQELSGITLIDLGDRAALAAVFAIVPDPGNIPVAKRPPHILATVHTLDDGHVSRILSNLSLSNLIFTRSVPEGMNSIQVSDGPGSTVGYLAWSPMSQGYSILMSSAPVLLAAISVILIIAFVSIRQNARVRQRLAERERQARFAANHDGMTGFSLRAHFSDQVHDLLAHADTGACALVYMDFDRLKQINDTHGHAAGDKLIKSASERIRNSLAGSDVLGRVGGDEFVALLWDRSSQDAIVEEILDLLMQLNQPIEFECTSIPVSCSAGLAFFPEHGKTLTELTRSADVALQRSKQTGGNTLRIFDQAMDRCLMEGREIREALAKALHNGEFALNYQPVIDVRSGRPKYAEALLRWHHPVRGLIPPDQFIPIAEDAGLMPEIGLWVLERAIADAARWKGLGVSVNIASSQLMQAGFQSDLKVILDANGYPAEKLVLEITETQILDQVEKTKQVLKELRAIGINCAMDDFGTGYSSLSYLHQYDFSTLKVDKRFVQESERNENSRKLLATVIDLGAILGMDVVVEGVETKEQLAFLSEIGCRMVQGYYYAKPLPVEEFEARWRCRESMAS